MKNFHPTIRIRLALQLISSLSSMAVIPYLIIYFSGQLGSTVTGVLFLCVMASNVLGSMIGGYVSDKIGRKKLIVVAELCITLGYMGAALSNYSWGTFPYVTCFFFVGIQFWNGVSSPIYQALVIDVSLPQDRKLIYTYSYWIRNLGVAIGSMIGAFFFFEYLFYLLVSVAVTTMVTMLITLLFIKETYQPPPPVKPTEHGRTSRIRFIKAYLHILKERFFAVFLLASFMIIAVEEQLTNYIGVRLSTTIPEPVPISPLVSVNVDGILLLGILKAENTIIVVCFTLLIIRFLKNYNDRVSLLTGLSLFFVGYSVISIATTPLLLLLAMCIVSIGEIIYIPTQQAMLSNLVPDHARSTYMALYSIAVVAGVSMAGVFLMMSSWLSPILLTGLISLMGLVSVLLFNKLTAHQESESNKQMDVV
ncbi:MFS transporter [Alkalihalobacillus pseudalcaliphilus]|uniref:MFS transporter n=1 Tax=Alkalihalobacillus pseudalcaliphilus TaxID=79884 RepID=UPI00064DA01F|nr:MFS transporter [Alkalihalobacillus pseudalcaliphilus]KMK77988.1 hypothetical protein AB990_00595 [Alkalihalobacillus pseudalcaliphilus]